MKQRNVVTSFIAQLSRDGNISKILLAKRSTKVHTYREHWASISGSIETNDPSPIARARIEISEETSLDPDAHLDLVLAGKPQHIRDSDLDTHWTIHPFLFALKSPELAERVHIDWEHTEAKWAPPEELENAVIRPTVPGLVETFRRVRVGPLVARGLRELQNDTVSGAQEMAVHALRVFRDGIDDVHTNDPNEFWRRLRMMGWHIAKNGRPSMSAAIEGGILRALTDVKKRWDATSVTTGRDVAQKVVTELISASESVTSRLKTAFLKFMADEGRNRGHITILTLSHSSTLRNCLAELVRRPPVFVKLLILESRPANEGVALAKRLVDENPNVEVEIASDASVGLFAQQATHLLLGADRITPSGDIFNKIGSLPAAILARRCGAKVVAVAQRDKISKSSDDKEDYLEEHAGDELLRAWDSTLKANGKVQVRNFYFEKVPADIVDVFLTEEGALDKEMIGNIWDSRQEAENTMFGEEL
ncbi:translation initiation factor eIF-2B subunit family protein [Fistulina hepatica ATCC 64428]|uniref:Translation initiation factor eIF-2B subunit family protein n=1 Tax=Fistulina hepatica ATCC 64428 TaxID=1128425 RepID=A0A0D7A215_9AGAR|nr:translation initiation factor eIF-2B subunit family protein [Fistulina hepatica ATCC 64428]